MKNVNQIMSDIVSNVPGLTDSQIVSIADQIEPLPQWIENLEDDSLLKMLGIREMSEDQTERFFTFYILPHTKDSLVEIRETYFKHPQIRAWLDSIYKTRTCVTILSPNYFQKEETK
jgi:hypothetical protein